MEPRRVASAGRDQSGKPTVPRGPVGHPRGPAGRIGTADVVLDAAIGTHGQAVRGDHGPQDSAREPLERGTVGSIDRGVGLEGEAVDERAPTSARRPGLGPRFRERHRQPVAVREFDMQRNRGHYERGTAYASEDDEWQDRIEYIPPAGT